jgi:excisionase family DNA binding protein
VTARPGPQPHAVAGLGVADGREPARPRSPFLLVEDAAAFLGCSARTVRERTRLREIPHRKPPGSRRVLFLESELLAWLDGVPLEVRELPRGGRVVRPKASP